MIWPSKNYFLMCLLITYLNQVFLTFRFNLSIARAQKVSMWKTKHGSFKEIQQMLELDGFGEKILNKFCSSIINRNDCKEIKSSPKTSTLDMDRKINLYCNPRLNYMTRSQIKSCLGVYVHAGGISWTKLTLHENKPMTLDAWSNCSFDERRMHLSELVSVTKKICEQMPIADTYVLESPIASQPSLPGKNVTQLHVNVQRSQLVGMTALGLLYKPQETFNAADPMQQVFFLRNFLPARLFRTKIGLERVSSENVVLDLLRCHYNVEEGSKEKLDESFASQVNASNEVRKIFEDTEPSHRDLIGQSFLTALTFVRLCVQKCQKSFEKLERRTN